MTQVQLIKKYIKEHGSISSYEAYSDLGITQLATRIKEMEESGIAFKKDWCKGINRYGKSCKYIKYSIKN